MKIIYSRLSKDNIYLLASVLASLFLIYFVKTKSAISLCLFLLSSIIVLRKWKLIIIFFLSFGIIFLIFSLTESQEVKHYISGEYKVKHKTSFGFVVDHKGNNIFVFSKKQLSVGDLVKISGAPSPPDEKFKNYYLSKNVKSVIMFSKTNLLKSTDSLFIKFLNYLKNSPETYKKIMPMIVLGSKEKSASELYSLSAEMNIAHLFVISGFHIWLIYKILKLPLKIMKDHNSDIICLSICFTYIALIGFPTSGLRAFLMILFSKLNKHLKLKRSPTEVTAVSLFFVACVKPFSVFGYSLPLTFIAAFTIGLINRTELNKFKKTLLIPFVIYISLMPVLLQFNNNISLMGPLFSIIATPIFTVAFVLSILLMFWKSFINFVLEIFENSIYYLNKVNIKAEAPLYLQTYSPLFYVLLLMSFIIYEIWNLYMAKKNI